LIADSLLACALMVHPITLNAVVNVESGGGVNAIHVNGIADKDQPHARDAADAAVIAHRHIDAGRSVDLGLMQVNSKNLPGLGLSVEQVLEPCTNLHAGGAILAAFYTREAQRYGQGQRALMAALSDFNTGNDVAGIKSGYVAKYFTVPSLAVLSSVPRIVPVATSPHASDTEIWE
jgi:type IV secretion system protein VirB1